MIVKALYTDLTLQIGQLHFLPVLFTEDSLNPHDYVSICVWQLFNLKLFLVCLTIWVRKFP